MLEIGSIIDGKYKILNKIGQGGMSVVYLAMNERANKQWAIKEVRKDGVKDYEVVRQGLIAETDILKRLNHPHLPSIIDVIDRDDTFLIVMDYIEGKALDYWLKKEGAAAGTGCGMGETDLRCVRVSSFEETADHLQRLKTGKRHAEAGRTDHDHRLRNSP